MRPEIGIRITFFIAVLAIIGLWEVLSPRQTLNDSKSRRWLSNLSLVFISTVLVRLVLPALPLGAAIFAQERSSGLMYSFRLPPWLAFGLGLLLLDFILYLQHVMFHYLPILWRLHLVHHTDLDLDVTTGIRFHPIEIIISAAIKITAVLLFGLPISAVIFYEVMMNAASMFNHGNIYIPSGTDWLLRLFIVTPDMHRVHHSVIVKETNSNFGNSFSWWDRLLGTYRYQPAEGYQNMTIGLQEFRDAKHLRLPKLLILPFRGRSDNKYTR